MVFYDKSLYHLIQDICLIPKCVTIDKLLFGTIAETDCKYLFGHNFYHLLVKVIKTDH